MRNCIYNVQTFLRKNAVQALGSFGLRFVVTGTRLPTIVLEPVTFSNLVVQIRFDVTSELSTTYTLLCALQPNGEFTTNTDAVLSTNLPGSSYTFTAPVTSNSNRFYRVQTP